MKTRLYEIVNDLVAQNRLTRRPAAGLRLRREAASDTLAPLMPGKMLNAAVNFYSHVGETGTPEEQKKAEAERRAKRGVPYLFIKPTRGAVIGDGDDIIIPARTRPDRLGSRARHRHRPHRQVRAGRPRPQDYVFGYTVTIDVSDRGGRPPGDSRPAPTGSSARATTRSRRWARGSCRRSSTAIR